MNPLVIFTRRRCAEMANMSLKRNEMKTQEPKLREHNFDEVALGYTE